MFVALTLTLLLALTVLRHIVEPACPGCAAKSWSSDPSALCCTKCGWTNAAKASAQVPPEELSGTQLGGAHYSSSQYEICFR